MNKFICNILNEICLPICTFLAGIYVLVFGDLSAIGGVVDLTKEMVQD